MNAHKRNPAPLATTLASDTTAVAAISSRADNGDAAADLVSRLKSSDDAVRGPAWQHAGPCGAAAVKPLIELMADADFEIGRSAKRALRNIVRHVGRPGARREVRAVEQELLAVLAGGTPSMRREIIWMLSEIGDDAAITPLAALLADPQLREDARCALTRLPGRRATSALKAALAEAPEDFRFALADSLRARGEKVSGHPSRKLVPTRPPLGNAPERKTASAQPS